MGCIYFNDTYVVRVHPCRKGPLYNEYKEKMEKLILIGSIILSNVIFSIIYNWYLYNIVLPKEAPTHPYAKYLAEKKQRKLEKKQERLERKEEIKRQKQKWVELYNQGILTCPEWMD